MARKTKRQKLAELIEIAREKGIGSSAFKRALNELNKDFGETFPIGAFLPKGAQTNGKKKESKSRYPRKPKDDSEA